MDHTRIEPAAHPAVRSHGLSDLDCLLVAPGEKGVSLFLAACDSLVGDGVPLQAVVVGDGREAPLVEASARTRPWFRRLGRIPHDDVLDLMAIASALVICSTYESGPLVLAEAIASGLPVVTTDVGRVRELVGEGNGRVCLREADAFASAIRETLAWDRASVREASKAFLGRIDFEETARELTQLVERARREGR